MITAVWWWYLRILPICLQSLFVIFIRRHLSCYCIPTVGAGLGCIDQGYGSDNWLIVCPILSLFDRIHVTHKQTFMKIKIFSDNFGTKLIEQTIAKMSGCRHFRLLPLGPSFCQSVVLRAMTALVSFLSFSHSEVFLHSNWSNLVISKLAGCRSAHSLHVQPVRVSPLQLASPWSWHRFRMTF